MAQKTVPIKYIGKKDFFPDFISQSGKSWNGYGDVQEVTADQAKKLLVHDGEFAEKGVHDALLVKQEEERAAAENAEATQTGSENAEGQSGPSPENEARPAQAAIEKPTQEEIFSFNKSELLALAATHAVNVNVDAPVVTLRKQLIDALHQAA